MMFYVYIDWTQEEIPRPFYVGKGNIGRVKKIKRNKKHSWVMSQFGLKREIICSTIEESFTLTLETQLIWTNDTFNPDVEDHSDIRCNLTTGGEGSSGHKHNEETKQKIRAKLSGIKRSDETLKKMSASKIGHIVDDQTRQRISDVNRGRKLSEAARKKISAALKRRHAQNMCQT